MNRDSLASKKMNNFIKQFVYPDNKNQNNYFLNNNITSKFYKCSSKIQLNIGHFQQNFESYGHSLSFNFKFSYVVPLMFDFDCKLCKTNKCTESLTKEITQEIIFLEICEIISKILQISVADVENNCIFFKKENSCNLHIYLNFSVSLILYDIIRTTIEANISADVTEKFMIDDITSLDLPYSTKDAENIYQPYIYLNKSFASFVVTPTLQFYDVPLTIALHEDLSAYMTLGTFNSAHKTTEWYDNASNNYYLITPLTTIAKKCTQINKNIQNIKIVNSKFATNINLLNVYFNDVYENTSDLIILDCTVLDKLGCTDYEKCIQKTLLLLSEKIAKLTFQEKTISQNSKFSYLLKFLLLDNCNFAFYSILTIISYVIKMNNYHQINNNIHKVAVLDILQLIIQLHDNPSHVEFIDRMIHVLYSFDIFAHLENIFKYPEKWLSEISNIVQVQKYSSTLEYLSSHITVYENIDDLKNILLVLCKLDMPMLKLTESGEIFYYYTNGLYVEVKENTLLTNNKLKIKSVYSNMNKFIIKLFKENQISEEFYNKIQSSDKFYKEVWIEYLQNVQCEQFTFNMYDYFILTDIGIFNTLTGMYMNNIPLIYMNTKKSYCTLPNNYSDMPMHVINRYICDSYQNTDIALSTICSKQTALFYLTVMLPGLLTLDTAMYTDNSENEILEKLLNIITNDDELCNETNIYYILPVIIHYKLDVTKIIQISELLKSNFINNGDYTINDILATEKHNKAYQTILSSKYTYENCTSIEIFNATIKLHFDDKFVPKLFTFAVILIIIDLCNNNYFESIIFNEPVTLKSSELPNIYSDSFNLVPFNAQDYSSDTTINFKRALSILLPNQYISNERLNIFLSFSAAFQYNSYCLDDFFTFASLIYHPNNERKKLLLLIGSPSCGKTTIQNFFHNMHINSMFSIESIVQNNNNGPAPELIQVHSSYLFNIVELKYISSEVLKTITGGDVVHKRKLHQNEYKELKPLAFTIAASNTIPIISGADEAIRDRLIPFMMKCKYVTSLNDYEDNALLLNLRNIIMKPSTFNADKISKDLSNLLYSQYCNKRNQYGLVVPLIHNKNSNSKKILLHCLCNNNYIYDILQKANIVFEKNLTITFIELERLLEKEIQKYNEEKSPKKKLTWYNIKNIMSTLFVNYSLYDNSGFSGFGLKIDNNLEPTEHIQFCASEKIKCIKIKKYLLTKSYTKDIILSILNEMKEKYASYYDKVFDGFIQHKLKI